MSKILTLDNLDAIKGYIDKQDQTTENACVQIIDDKFNEKLDKINSDLESVYNGVLKEIQEDLDALDSKHTEYETKTDPRIDDLESFEGIVNSVLDIKPTGNTHYSEKLKSLETKINSVSGGGSSNNATLSASDLANLLNDSAVIGQLSNSSNFGSGIINLIQTSGKITPSTINSGTINNITFKPGKKSTWEWNSDGTGNIGGTAGIRVNQNGELTIGNSVKLNFYDNISNQSDIINGIVNDCKKFITNDIIDDVIDKLGDTEGSVVHEILKPYNYALGYNKEKEEDNYTEIVDGKEVSRIRLNRIDNIESVSDINQTINDIPTVDLKESIGDMFETEYENITKTVDGKDTNYKILKSNRLNKLDYALGYDRNNEEDNYTEIVDGKEVSRIRLNRIDNIEERLDHNDQTLDINQTINDIPTVDLKESIGNMLETEYETINKTMTEGNSTITKPYNILKSKRLDDIEDLLYINKKYTNAEGGTSLYYNIISAIAGSPSGMPTGGKFRNSTNGVLDLVFDNKDGNMEPRSQVLDYIKNSIGDWQVGVDENNKNTIKKNIDKINENIGNWNIGVNGENTIYNAINSNISDINDINTNISAHISDFDNYKIAQTTKLTDLTSKVTTLDNSFKTNTETLSSVLSALSGSVKTDELAELLVQFLQNGGGVEVLNTYLKDYLKIVDANDTYVSKESLTEQLNNYATKLDLTDTINTELNTYYDKTDVNNLIKNFITETTANTSYASKAEFNTLNSNINTNTSSIQNNTTNISNIFSQLAEKASKSDLTNLQTTVNNKANASEVYNKSEVYTKSEIDNTLNGNITSSNISNNSVISNLTTKITNLESSVNNKADLSTVNNLQTTVNNKADLSTVSDLQTLVSNLNQTLASYQSTIQTLETKVNDLLTRVGELEHEINNQ